MKVSEILVEHKKGIRAKKYNKKPKSYIEPKKPKKAAYGPGPGGAYGTNTGFSGDGGVGESNDWHISPSGVKTNMNPMDDDYEINYGKNGLVAKFRKDKGLDVKTGSRKVKADENFADGKNPGRKGQAKRSGVNCKASVSTLRNVAKNSSGEKQRMAHWCANMKSGRSK